MSNGLTNDDFRKIMATPRRIDVEDTPRKSTAASGFAKPAAPKVMKSRPSKPSKPESLLPPGYRDRAQERREREQAGIEEAPIENEQITAEDIEALPDHLSKYLGGDENRTHLVKGLDYLLLEQSREKILKEEELKLEKAMAHAAAAVNVEETEPQESSEPLSFKTSMARNIYSKCIEQVGNRASSGHQTSTFQPGRTVYEFETDTFGSATVPTILHRSEEDCGPVIHNVSSKLPPETWARLEEAMNCIRSGVKPRKVETSVDAPVNTPLKPSAITFDDDDDIFADVGEYVCEPRDVNAAPVLSGRVVFAPDTDASETVEEHQVSMQEAIMQARSTAGQLGVYEKNLPSEEPDAEDNEQKTDSTAADTEKKSARLLSMMDDYDEYTAGAQMGYDSDEEMLTTAEKKVAQSATKISKSKAKEKQKLNSQWQKISGMIERKKDAKRRGESADDNSLHKKKSRLDD